MILSAMVVVASVTSSCSTRTLKSAERPGTARRFVATSGSLRIELDPAARQDASRLRIEPLSAASATTALSGSSPFVTLLGGYSIHPSGPLAKPATVRFTVPHGTDPRFVLVATQAAEGEPWDPVATVSNSARHEVVVTAKHFSNLAYFNVDVAGVFRTALTPSGSSGASSNPPECSNPPRGATLAMNADPNNPAIVACVGTEAGSTVIKVGDNRDIALSGLVAGATSATAQGDSVESIIIHDFEADLPHTSYIPPGGVATLTLTDPTKPFQILFGPDPAEFLVSALFEGASMLVATYDPSGASAWMTALVRRAAPTLKFKEIADCVMGLGINETTAIGRCLAPVVELIKEGLGATGGFGPMIGLILTVTDLSALVATGLAGLVQTLTPQKITYAPPAYDAASVKEAASRRAGNPATSGSVTDVTHVDCEGDWASGCVINSITGDSDCTGFFRRESGVWQQLDLSWDACPTDLVGRGAPTDIAKRLAINCSPTPPQSTTPTCTNEAFARTVGADLEVLDKRCAGGWAVVHFGPPGGSPATTGNTVDKWDGNAWVEVTSFASCGADIELEPVPPEVRQSLGLVRESYDCWHM